MRMKKRIMAFILSAIMVATIPFGQLSVLGAEETVETSETDASDSETMTLKVIKSQGEGVGWISDTEAALKFHATAVGTYYVTAIKTGMKLPTFEEVKKQHLKTGKIEKAEEQILVKMTMPDPDNDVYVLIYGEDTNGVPAKKCVILPLKARKSGTVITPTPTQAAKPTITPTPTQAPKPTATPKPTQAPKPTATPKPTQAPKPTATPKPTQTPKPTAKPTVPPTTRAPYTPAVTESKVTGFEKPLAFYPGLIHRFTVTGAGSDNKNPVKGDVRWNPLYWSSFQNPITQSQKQSIGTIGHKTGISVAKEFTIYIFFQKYVYNGRKWQPVRVVSSMPCKFWSKAINLSETPTPTPANQVVTPTPTPTPVVIKLPSNIRVKPGKTYTLKTTAALSNVKYSSSNKKVAIVNKRGKIKAVRAGKAKITVRSGKSKATCIVTVPGTTAIKNIKTSLTLKKGKTKTLKPKLSYVISKNKVTYKSSNSKIVAVNSKGKIKGKKKGTATITVKSGKITKKCKVTVK